MGGRGNWFKNLRGKGKGSGRGALDRSPPELPGLSCLPAPREVETFGANFRAALDTCKLPFIQVIEAGVPGAPDYVVGRPPAGAVCYVELKVADNTLEESQRRFFPRLLAAGCNLVVLRHRGNLIERWDGLMKTRVCTYSPFERTVDWKTELFTKRS